VPAAAVIPAPIAHIKFVAVETLVVGRRYRVVRSARVRGHCSDWYGMLWLPTDALHRVSGVAGTFTLRKPVCLKGGTF
jgi:hypothetical protein